MIDKKCDVILSNLDYDDIMLISDLMQGSEDPKVHKFARKINRNLTIVREIDLPLVKAFHKQVKKSGKRIRMIWIANKFIVTKVA